ncbi:MAG: DUF1385 domain-containing protein [Lachnospiraceae bacterium]|nr:DUF1385 domain-containing protein [Lachnospiraceae bacterium]
MNDKPIKHYSGIGGLAVLDGVMMRNRDRYAVAVRKEDGHVAVKVEHWHALLEGSVLLRVPFVRGIFVFIDSMRLSLRAMGEATEAPGADTVTDASGKKQKGKRETGSNTAGSAAEGFLTVLTFLFSFALAIGLFVMLPYFLASMLVTYIRSESLLSVFEGLLRIMIFVLYILLISRLSDIRRLFGYHGAEHKCINCIESGQLLTVENVRTSSRLHKRCGSSFILFVMLVSIVLFFFIRVESVPLRLLLRILLLPVVSGISYELIRLAGRSDNILVRALSAPGFWMQHLTTREPDDDMIEIGIRSVEAVFDWRSYLHDTFGYEFNYE